MKPLGAITKYYRFIDEESKSILNSIMDESSSYFDLVQRLSNVVLEDEIPVDLAYVAAVQAWWARAEKAMNLIQEKYKDVPCIRPWGYRHATAESDQVKYHNAVVEAIERAMNSSLADWMATELHLLHTFFHWPYHGDIPSCLEPLEKAKSLISADPLLNCFEPLVYVFDGSIRRREGDAKGGLVAYQRGLELSETHDDSLFRYLNLIGKANVLRNIDIEESLQVFEKTYELTQELEVPYFVSEVMNDSALAYQTAGEYDLAISCHHEGIDAAGLCDTTCLSISAIYAALGVGQESLEWVDRAFECVGNLEIPALYVAKAWALALLDRPEEAQDNLDIAYSMIIKTGSDLELPRYYTVSGITEAARGDYLAAIDLLERTLEIAEQYPRSLNLNTILLSLARVELALGQESKESAMSFEPGKWLSRLENHALEHHLPGIRMQAALLKSEFYQNHGQLRDAHAILQHALEISDSPGVRTLTKRITDRIQELNRLTRVEETASPAKKTQSGMSKVSERTPVGKRKDHTIGGGRK